MINLCATKTVQRASHLIRSSDLKENTQNMFKKYILTLFLLMFIDKKIDKVLN